MSEKQPLIPVDPPPAYDASQAPRETLDGKPPRKPRAPFPLDLPILNHLRGKRVVLASASPRRKQLLAQIGLTILEIVPSTDPEDLPKTLTPFEYVLQTATKKALAVYAATITSSSLHTEDPTLLIAADTIVVSAAGSILEKPRSEAQHIAMLKELRDTGRHSVITAVACMAPLESARDPGYALRTTLEETVVAFDKELTDDVLLAYVKTREGADKAGGYGIQGMGALLVERIEGGFENVVGLPLRKTLKLMEKVIAEAEGDDEDDDEEEEAVE